VTTPPGIRFHHGRSQRAEAQGLTASGSEAIQLKQSLAFGLPGEPGYRPAAAWASTRLRFYHGASSDPRRAVDSLRAQRYGPGSQGGRTA
jgi:hypothetical protein